jgi:hypothetical protein
VERSLVEGDPLELKVEASSSLPITFQWHRDGQPLPDAHTDTFTLQQAGPTDSGVYGVFVRNALGVTLSERVVVTVAPKPPDEETPLAISVVGGIETDENTRSIPEQIDISADPDKVDAVVLSAESLDPILIPTENISFSGTGAVRFVSMLPLEDQHGTARIILRATLGTQEVSQTVELKVVPKPNPPVLNWLPESVHIISGQPYSIGFEVIDPDGDAVDVQITVSPPESAPLVALEGGASDWTALITSLPEQTGSFTLACLVRDTTGLEASGVCVLNFIEPRLAIGREENDLVLRWPSNCDFRLQVSENIVDGWHSAEDLANLVLLNDGECRVSWSGDSPPVFFRITVQPTY